MEKVFTEIQKINSRFELMEQRLSFLEEASKVTNRKIRTRNMDRNESQIGANNMVRSNLGTQDEPQPCSSRNIMIGDIALNERGSLPGMFMLESFQQINS